MLAAASSDSNMEFGLTRTAWLLLVHR
ncbi:hypothetical protein MAR_028932 [Mya arenaria]|uniref:Uncharacterized protein n=1 Tax=Mya arenaria TaxID=6604 RepID=A0ABY7DHQ4_MYAAR|nr:hypothetical protein MAR_028932 [Mya arenaria]